MEKEGTMKAITRTKDGSKSPFLADVPIPKPTPNHVIVKVMASPINPSDDYFCRGYFGGVDHEPYVCGFEGAGVITEVGEGVSKDVIGKKVTAWPTVGTPKDKVGMWCPFARIPYDACVFLRDTDKCEDFCELFVNPLTLLAFVRITKEMKLKALVHTAALSALGRALIKVCVAEGIDLIGVIRKEEDKKLLLDMGAKYALNINDSKFEEELKDATHKLDARVAFDAVCGNLTGQLVKNMPPNSVIYTYGRLSGEQPKLQGLEEVMKVENKKIEGFVVMQDKIMTDPTEKKEALELIEKDIKNDGHFFKVKIARKFKLDEFETALDLYKKIATQGKVIFTPNP